MCTQARVQHLWSPSHQPTVAGGRRHQFEGALVAPLPAPTQVPDRGERCRRDAVAGTDLVHSELHVLGFQLLAELPDQLSGGNRIVGEPPGTSSVTSRYGVEKRS